VAPAGEATRRRLLDAAERLVAERGIDGVTVNEITAASGARNKSAVAYHFGSKLALLEASDWASFATAASSAGSTPAYSSKASA
jgi:AcrR family transcriptional regulator